MTAPPPGCRSTRLPARRLHRTPSIDINASVYGMMQHVDQGRPVRTAPLQLALANRRAPTVRQPNVMIDQVMQDAPHAAQTLEQSED
jgi:hypothetical protein